MQDNFFSQCVAPASRIRRFLELTNSSFFVIIGTIEGGIGLSGGACGALGAAIWIIGMNGRQEQAGNKVINSRITDAINRFIKSTDFEFECSEMVGRKFENIGDHAGYLRAGGCSNVIEALATQ